MFPLTPDQHHWLDVATEDVDEEGWLKIEDDDDDSVVDQWLRNVNVSGWLMSGR